jgi:hypothetical protein
VVGVEARGAPLRARHVGDDGGAAKVVDGAAPGVDEGAVRARAAGAPASVPSDAECEADSPADVASRSTPGSGPTPGAEKNPLGT